MVSKHRENVLVSLDKHKILSTNDVLKKTQKRAGVLIHWNIIYRILNELAEDGLVEKLNATGGFYWRLN